MKGAAFPRQRAKGTAGAGESGPGRTPALAMGGGGSSVTKSCPTLATPRTVARQAPLCMGFSRQEHWSGLPPPSPGGLSEPGMETKSPALAGGFFTAQPAGKPETGRVLDRQRSWRSACPLLASRWGLLTQACGKPSVRPEHTGAVRVPPGAC